MVEWLDLHDGHLSVAKYKPMPSLLDGEGDGNFGNKCLFRPDHIAVTLEVPNIIYYTTF